MKLVSATLLLLQLTGMIPQTVLANEISQHTNQSESETSKSSLPSEETSTTVSERQVSPSSSATIKSSKESSSETTARPTTESSSTSTSTIRSKPDGTTLSSQQESVSKKEQLVTPAVQPQKTQGEVPSETQTSDVIESPADGSIHFEKDESVDSFIRRIGESARKIGQEKDLYASVMIAQAILESSSGQSQLAQAPNYNLFGVKGFHNGKSISMATQEDSGNGSLYTIQSDFRVYKNYEDCFNDYAALLKAGTFYAGAWKSNAKTYQEATKYLTGRYATDTQYNQKLNGLIETYDLTQYDKAAQENSINTKGYQVPVDHYTISSPFGNRDGEFHRGLDLAANQGEPIHACKDGTVIKAEYHPSWGNYVAIEHADGMTTLYAHQQQYIVKVGDKVKQGQTIGYVGSTGNSTGPHVHVEVCKDTSLTQSQLIDPQDVLFGK